MASNNTARDKKTRDAGPVRAMFSKDKAKDADPLDRIIHERMRLAIVSVLAVNESLSFNELKKLLDTTDGNLSVHARKLEEAKYIKCKKFFEGRTPKTEFAITDKGRKALERYLSHMEALINAVRKG